MQFPTLYTSRIVPRFDAGVYERAIESGLRARESRNNPPPFFVGLVPVEGALPAISRRAEKSAEQLAAIVGAERVIVRALSGIRTDAHLLISSWTPLGVI